MATEVWFRNPHDYVRELVEVGYGNIAWDRGLLTKRRIDPLKHADLFFGQTMEYRILLVGAQGTAEYRRGCTLDTPVAVYPTWQYGEDSDLLLEMIEDPIGEDKESCNDQNVRDDERPILGQEHRVVITNMPNTRDMGGRQFVAFLRGLQLDHPECIIHMHGTYGWRLAFGSNLGAADVAPREAAQKGRLHLPSGSVVKYEEMRKHPKWAAALGYTPEDLTVPRNRCMFNIKSALWAGENYEKMFKFRTQGAGSGDYTSPANKHVPAETKSPLPSGVKTQPGDKMVCDMCSLQNDCKFFRSGAVCSLPGAEPVRLSKMFNTRNADDIIDGLSMIVSSGANRLERGMQFEQAVEEMDPEVSKMMGQVFDQGVKLAKLLDPQRFSPGAKVQVNVGANGQVGVQGGNPRQLVAATIQELVRQGYPRDQITPQMIQGAIEGMQNPETTPKSIAGGIIASEAVTHEPQSEDNPS
jgi:hypothetical protein